MTVYVDTMRAPYGRMIMCHMIADTREELDAMADRVGVARKWIQQAGTPGEHYDICLSAKANAIAAGAVLIDRRTLGEMILARREAAARLTDRADGPRLSSHESQRSDVP